MLLAIDIGNSNITLGGIQEGEILFSQRDLDRLPSGFEQELAQALPAGGSLKISREPRKIDGGFVLVYGGVEHALLFAGGQA